MITISCAEIPQIHGPLYELQCLVFLWDSELMCPLHATMTSAWLQCETQVCLDGLANAISNGLMQSRQNPDGPERGVSSIDPAMTPSIGRNTENPPAEGSAAYCWQMAARAPLVGGKRETSCTGVR
jgi:hypothetical protein